MTWKSYIEIGVVISLAVCFAKFMCGWVRSASKKECDSNGMEDVALEKRIIVPSFQTSIAIPKLIEWLKSNGFRLIVLRKKEALQKFVGMYMAKGRIDIANMVEKVMTSGGAILTPLNATMNEDWKNAVVVNVEDPTLDEMTNAFILSDTGRCKVI